MANAPLMVPMADGTVVAMTVDEARAALATRGLHVVDAADRAVLDACAALGETTCRWYQSSTPWRHVARAQLARWKVAP